MFGVQKYTINRKLPRQVSASHDKSPPRMTILRLARQVSASHEEFLVSDNMLVHTSSSPPLTKTRSTQCGATSMHEPIHYDTWGASSPCHASAPASGMRGQPALTGALMQLCSTVRPSTCHHIQPCSTPTPTEALEFPL
jgi:hypothetical protein